MQLLYFFFRYEEFIENSGHLNDLHNYPQLQERSKRIGYEISKVVFRGYHASDKLQVRCHQGVGFGSMYMYICISLLVYTACTMNMYGVQ